VSSIRADVILATSLKSQAMLAALAIFFSRRVFPSARDRHERLAIAPLIKRI
jgi:hypothetical protein